jgi:GNAT superfamily N-acetyltransferase
LSTHDLVVDWLASEEIPAAAYVISRALVTNPNSIAFWGGKDEKHRLRIERTIRIANLQVPRSHPIAAKLRGKIVGVVNLIESPYCQVSFVEGLKLAPAMLWINREAVLRCFHLGRIGARLDPREPHMHLGPIGVLPEMQGKGIGSGMLAFACAYLDQRQWPVYLETDQPGLAAHLLQPFGFQVTGEADILGVHNWCIWRKPQDL